MQPGPARHVQIEAVGAPLKVELRSAGTLDGQPRRIQAADAHLASAARMNGAFVRSGERRAHSRSATGIDRMQLRRLDGDRDPMFAAQAGVRFEPDVQRAILNARLHQRKDLVIRRIPAATLTALNSGTSRSSPRAKAAVEDNETIARATAPRGIWPSGQMVISSALRFHPLWARCRNDRAGEARKLALPAQKLPVDCTTPRNPLCAPRSEGHKWD